MGNLSLRRIQSSYYWFIVLSFHYCLKLPEYFIYYYNYFAKTKFKEVYKLNNLT
jgi:hypothetical protein